MEADLINHREDRCMTGESMSETETGLINDQHDRCMSDESKCSKWIQA